MKLVIQERWGKMTDPAARDLRIADAFNALGNRLSGSVAAVGSR